MERSTYGRVRIRLLVQQREPWKEILGHLSLKPQNRGRLDHVYCKTELSGGLLEADHFAQSPGEASGLFLNCSSFLGRDEYHWGLFSQIKKTKLKISQV